MSNHWILGELAKSYAQEEREKAMTTDEYDRLLDKIQRARQEADAYRALAASWDARLDKLLHQLSREEHRLVQQALTSIHSASRKLVVGE